MKASAGDYILENDDDYDEEELSEPEEIYHEDVKIWRENTMLSSANSGEITALYDDGNKGNTGYINVQNITSI